MKLHTIQIQQFHVLFSRSFQPIARNKMFDRAYIDPGQTSFLHSLEYPTGESNKSEKLQLFLTVA